jgi:hypothetical protein
LSHIAAILDNRVGEILFGVAAENFLNDVIRYLLF